MMLSRPSGLLGASFLGLIALVVACSSDDDKPAAPGPCQDSQCIKDNKCIDDGTSTQCRLTCAKQSTCGEKSYCTVNPKGDATYCAKLTGFAAGIAKKETGQWGASCRPELGFDANPDCDADQSFWCYGENPTDGEAFCTQYQCEKDSDCIGGWWCATINLEPSVRRVRRTVKETTTVCLPRSYCSTCKHDVDCPTRDGNPQYCVTASDDTKFCSSECTTDNNCRGDARCVEEGDRRVCKPIAGVCKGDGSFCAPCRSDADCADNSVCARAQNSREQFCIPKSGVQCRSTSTGITADCPDAPKADGLKLLGVGCQTTRDDPEIPKDYCVPFIQYGKDENNVIPACWTRPKDE